VAWIEGRRAKDGTVTWFVYWREAGRNSAKKSVKAGRRRRDAERLAVEIQARVNAGLVGGGVVAKRATFGEFAGKWLEVRIARPTTLRRDRGLINTYLRPAFASTLLNAITVEDVRVLLARVTKEQSPSTSRRLLAVLGKMFTDAVRSDYVRQNPIEKLDRRDKPQARKIARAVDMDELLGLLKSLPERWAIFSLVAVLTGLRWGEIASLEWSDIDFETGKIHVRRATPAGTKGPQDPKSLTSQRSIDMLWPVRRVLLDMPQRGRLVFPGARGRLLNHGWFHRHIWLPAARAVQATRARGSHLRFHDLRHGFASLLLAWGEPILYVSRSWGTAAPPSHSPPMAT
jgi:integrase